jgi:hypothetical protein
MSSWRLTSPLTLSGLVSTRTSTTIRRADLCICPEVLQLSSRGPLHQRVLLAPQESLVSTQGGLCSHQLIVPSPCRWLTVSVTSLPSRPSSHLDHFISTYIINVCIPLSRKYSPMAHPEYGAVLGRPRA